VPGCGTSVTCGVHPGARGHAARPKDIAIVSGIGCSGRFSHFIKSYAYHTAHGRALPTAIGVKAANPISRCSWWRRRRRPVHRGGHIPHAARRNPDITYLILDNAIYGLTKGQGSPTCRSGWSPRHALRSRIRRWIRCGCSSRTGSALSRADSPRTSRVLPD